MVVHAEQHAHVVAGFAVLVQDQDAVGDAVGELLGLCAQVLGREDAVFRRVVGHKVARVEVLAVEDGLDVALAEGERDVPEVDARGGHVHDEGGDDLTEDPVARLDVGGDRGLFGVKGVIVVQKGGGLDDRVGEIVRGAAELPERAEHAVGLHAAQLALHDLRAVRQQGVVQGRGDQVAHVHVPGAGADLAGLALADVDHRDQHVVGVGVLVELDDAPDHHVFDLDAQILGDLHLGAGDAHGLGEAAVVDLRERKIHELIEPFSG